LLLELVVLQTWQPDALQHPWDASGQLWKWQRRCFCSLCRAVKSERMEMIESLTVVPRKGRRIALAVLAALCAPVMAADPSAAATSTVHSADRASYVLLAPGSRSSTMSGSMDDMHRAEALRSGREGLLYTRQKGIAYVIRDAATLRQAEAIFEPQRALGAQQAALGKRQAALGQRQGRLGAEQGRLGRLQAASAPRRVTELGRQQSDLGQQQGELGRQQGVLGRQQSALGQEQARLARIAESKLEALVAEAVRRGVAQRVD
jgi:hypothetical protein